jgi:anti-sigma B factor antagonist
MATDSIVEEQMSPGNEGALQLNGRPFAMQSRRTDACEHIRLVGEMDLSVIDQVDREMRRAEATDAASIVLDMEELEFLDAAGIRLLLTLDARSRRNGGRLRIRRGPFPQVQRVLELTGVGDLLPFED